MTLLWLTMALAGDPVDPPDLREDVGRGAAVNWTTLTLEVTRDGFGRGVGATHKAVEHDVRDALPDGISRASGSIRVATGVDVADLLYDEDLGDMVGARVGKWVVGEARYYASGRIELVAELPLLDLLKPWSLEQAVERPADLRTPELTGLLIDARGTDLTPCWSPRVLADAERELWDGATWMDVALAIPPVVWVSDPAHPASARAGADPMVVRAVAARGCDPILDPIDAARFRTALSSSDVLREGTVVIVVDAP